MMQDRCDPWAKLYLQRQNKIGNRNVWLYLISSAIGNFAVVDYEMPGMEIKRRLFEENYDKAESYFESVSRRMVSGKL